MPSALLPGVYLANPVTGLGPRLPQGLGAVVFLETIP
jgi:hypothetical protein